MEPIASFTIDHTKLKRGIYVSRLDTIGRETVTTFDIRMKAPNLEPVLDVPALHTIEHLGATFLRNHKTWSEKVIYFGPMGCRTGCYLLLAGTLSSRDILPLIRELFQFIADYNNAIPGATPEGCGNYLSQDLPVAKWESKKYLIEILDNISEENLTYPVSL